LDDFITVFPSIDNPAGDLGFGLNSDGDAVRLFDSANNLIDSVVFTSNDPWPSQANGFGSTLELINPDLDNAVPENWAVSSILGTPGYINSKFELPYHTPPVSEDEVQKTPILIFPNPSTSHVNFRIFLEIESLIVLNVYDILGRKVTSIVNNRFLGRGKSTITWDYRNAAGNTVSAGVYFYMLKINHRIVEIGKFIKL
jgi:hypothetical protein